MEFHRIVALEAGVLPLLNHLWLMIVGHRRRQRKIPERFLRRNIEQAHVTRFGCARLAYPLNAKVGSVLAIGQTDDFVEIELGFHTAQLDSVLANIDRHRLSGEHPATAVRAKDSHRCLDLFARLATPAHLEISTSLA